MKSIEIELKQLDVPHMHNLCSYIAIDHDCMGITYMHQLRIILVYSYT